MSLNTFSTTDTGWPFNRLLSGHFSDIRPRFANWLLRQRRYRETVYELSRCSDRELQDIGIARSNIHQLAREGCFPKFNPER